MVLHFFENGDSIDEIKDEIIESMPQIAAILQWKGGTFS